METAKKLDPETELVDAMAGFAKDPYAWVLFSFPWGKGELEKRTGPEDWQAEELKAIRDALQSGKTTPGLVYLSATASGHGIGKSAMVSWLILWGLSTFADTKVVVTANTATQLATKTWAELAKWHRLFIAGHWFEYTATSLYAKDRHHEKTWRADAVTWSVTNSEAFAGLHNQGKRLLIIFDEASGIADKVWEVAEGCLTDEGTEIFWFPFGNPTRAVGRFRECFRRLAHRWRTRQVDSRTVTHTNKKQIQEWIDDYGENSDFVKVRVKGEFPNSSDRQFIAANLVDAARVRKIHESQYSFAPRIIGVDPALYGEDECVIVLRQGLACQILFKARKLGDDFLLAQHIARFETEHQADAVFVDFGGGSGAVSAGKQMGRKWTLVNFGDASADPQYLNKRAEMWGSTREWLKDGGVIPDDPILGDQLTAPEFHMKLNGKICLQSKEDMRREGIPSPDRADALAITFAYPVVKKAHQFPGVPGALEFANQGSGMEFSNGKYNPLGGT